MSLKMPCKGCKTPVHVEFPVDDNCVRFNDFGQQLPGHNDTWVCFMCTDHVCLNCYTKHIETAHPEEFSAACETCGEMTLYKDFVNYHWCVKCKPVAEENHSCKGCKPWEHKE